MRFSKEFLLVSQALIETYIVRLAEDTNKIIMHKNKGGKRLDPEDIQLTRSIRGETN
jgi:histone H3/H4